MTDFPIRFIHRHEYTVLMTELEKIKTFEDRYLNGFRRKRNNTVKIIYKNLKCIKKNLKSNIMAIAKAEDFCENHSKFSQI